MDRPPIEKWEKMTKDLRYETIPIWTQRVLLAYIAHLETAIRAEDLEALHEIVASLPTD